MSKNMEVALDAVAAETPEAAVKRTRSVKPKTFLVGFTSDAEGNIAVADKVNLSALSSAEAVAVYRDFMSKGYKTIELSI